LFWLLRCDLLDDANLVVGRNIRFVDQLIDLVFGGGNLAGSGCLFMRYVAW
jgi:hypothetical protein